MDTSTMLVRYGKYFDYLQKLGEYSLRENPSIRDLGLNKNKKLIQNGYKEMKEIGGDIFSGNLIDYLCYISTLFIIREIETRSENKAKSIDDSLMSLIDDKKSDLKNLLRLFNRNPQYFLNYFSDANSVYYSKGKLIYDESYMIFNLKMVMRISGLWYIMLRGENQPELMAFLLKQYSSKSLNFPTS